MSLPLNVTSALNLTLEGSTGSFSVGRGGDERTIEVKYLLTHLSLDLAAGSNEEMLRHLRPVREIFRTRELGFDEIMQRDIDDARVSSELVPYLLDRKSRDLIKLFPPIVVVVMPVRVDANAPADLYPAVETFEGQANGQNCQFVRSGAAGQEVFEFVQPLVDGKLYEHDLVRLRLNTNKSRLVIVDGQHRAMALLALYRNLKQDWEDQNKAPYRDYYEEWTPSYIRTFELSRISLPVMVCTFPQLDEAYQGDYDVKRAARSIFLTLNKTARQVSESRNRLLDDNDLIAQFLRDTLSTIKAYDDVHEQTPLRIHNVELDQAHDRVKLDSPIALSGVNHIYYLIEHLVLNKMEDVSGAKPRAGYYTLRADLANYGAIRRLNGYNLLGDEVANSTYRYSYGAEAGEKLTASFRDTFGALIVNALSSFGPFAAHSRAVLWLDEQLRTQANTKVRPILFEGQGISRTFESHRANLAARIRDKDFGEEAPKLKEILARLDATSKLVLEAEHDFKAQRADRMLADVSDKKSLRAADGRLHPKVTEFVTGLYENVLTTVAFQTALVGGFFGEIERADVKLAKQNLPPIDAAAAFEGYMSDINRFFTPGNSNAFRRLVDMFQGSLGADIGEWKITPSNSTFRKVVYRGEMQPAQWPKYKYLLLELWRPTDDHLKASMSAERDLARHQIYNSLEKEYRREFLERELRREESLTSPERTQIANAAYEAFKQFLRNLGWNTAEVPSKADLQRSPTPEDASEAPEVDDADAITAEVPNMEGEENEPIE